MKNQTQTQIQIIARLAWVSHLASWNNVHAEMKPAVSGLIRRGLAERTESDNGLRLTDAGEEMLRAAKIPFVADLASNGPTAQYWTDQWGQQIPA